MSDLPVLHNSRRMFLKGVGGALLAIPFLPSLARGQTGGGEKFFVTYISRHGGLWASNMYPAIDNNFTTASPHGFQIRSKALGVTTNSQGISSLCPVLTSNRLTSRGANNIPLYQKLNAIQGIDAPELKPAHGAAYCLGNHGAGDSGLVISPHQATVDQVIAHSESFYPGNAANIKARVISFARDASYYYQNPTTKSGGISVVRDYQPDTLNWFDRLYSPPSGGGGGQTSSLIDNVLESYNLLRNSARLSQADKARLEEHISRLENLERQFSTVASCGNVQRPSRSNVSYADGQDQYKTYVSFNFEKQAQFYSLVNDLIAMAFSCGTARIAVIDEESMMAPYLELPDFWHSDKAHNSDQPAIQAETVTVHQKIFDNHFLDLAQKLDSITYNENANETLLDRSLLQWVQDAGPWGHYAYNLPVITAGSAGGYLNTGLHLDLRNRNKGVVGGNDLLVGYSMHQWNATICNAMGLQRSEYELSPDVGGFGLFNHQLANQVLNNNWDLVANASVLTNMSENLPFL